MQYDYTWRHFRIPICKNHFRKKFLCKNTKMKNQVFCIKIAKNGLKIDEKCQKMSNNFHFSFFSAKIYPKKNKEIIFFKFLSKNWIPEIFRKFCDHYWHIFRPISPFSHFCNFRKKYSIHFRFSQKSKYAKNGKIGLKMCQ